MTEQEVREKFDELYTKYQQTMEMLVDALDNITSLEKQLDKKPKEVIIEKEVEKIVEVPVEVIKETVVEREVPVEKIVEVEVAKEVEVIKEIERIVEKEVPGPERIVEVKVPGPERRVEVPGPERVVVRTDNSKLDKLSSDNKTLKHLVTDLQQQLNKKPKEVEKIVEVEKAATGDLKEAARIMASSELNKEDLSEEEIFNLLQKSSEEDVRKKIGFWAQPLPTDTDQSSNKIYISKK